MKTWFVLLLSLGLVNCLVATEKKAPTKKTAVAAGEAKTKGASAPKPSKSDAAAASLSPTQKSKLMSIVNEGDQKALVSLPGIGEGRAEAIKKARPLKEPTDLLKVEGIGEETFSEIVKHAKAGFPAAEPRGETKKQQAGRSKAATAKPKTAAKSS